MCRLKRARDGAVSLAWGEGSCDALVTGRGSCPPEESGFEDGVNVVCTYSNIGRPYPTCQRLSQMCMVRALCSWTAMLARIRWCRLDKPSISISLAVSVHCCDVDCGYVYAASCSK
jgi:hypothetical protein